MKISLPSISTKKKKSMFEIEFPKMNTNFFKIPDILSPVKKPIKTMVSPPTIDITRKKSKVSKKPIKRGNVKTNKMQYKGDPYFQTLDSEGAKKYTSDEVNKNVPKSMEIQPNKSFLITNHTFTEALHKHTGSSTEANELVRSGNKYMYFHQTPHEARYDKMNAKTLLVGMHDFGDVIPKNTTLYRGTTKYSPYLNDPAPQSWSTSFKAAMGFATEGGTVLKYTPKQDIKGIDVRLHRPDYEHSFFGHEKEIILPPKNYMKLSERDIPNDEDDRKLIEVMRKKKGYKLAKPKSKRANVMFKGKDYDVKPPNNIRKIATILNAAGGKTYIVGGYVRDILLDKKPKDVDIEVHGLTLEEMSSVLRQNGYKVDEVGKSFGVLKVKCPDTGEIIDVAVPRTDSTGRKPDVSFLKSATPYDAAKRRDLTINAIMYDVASDKIIDPFNGVGDLERGNIKHVSNESFSDDPLRTIRAAQFASRFEGFTIDPETKRLARDVDSSKMAPERVTEEMRKVMEKSKRPSVFFNELDDMGQLEKLFPEVKQLQSVRQDPIHHPEGNAYIHTMQVMDRISASDKRSLEMLVASLFHDLGKITKSTEDPETKRIHAKGHEIESEKMASKLLAKYKFTNNEIRDILTIVKNHMKPHMLVNSDALRLKHKHGLMRDICTTKNMMKDPTGSIKRYCDVVEFAKHDHTKDGEKYEELQSLPPLEHYQHDISGDDLYERGLRGKEIGNMMEEMYLSKINHWKKKKSL